MSAYRQRYSGRSSNRYHAATPPPIITNNKQWACPECTFLNDAHKTKCDMCLTPKPKPPSIHSTSLSNSYISPSNENNYRFLNNPPSKQLPQIKINNNNNKPLANRQNLGKKPKQAILPKHITFNPQKSKSSQSIFERWMISQMEMQSGQQPSICVANNVVLANLHRIRAPTTFETLQQQINENTNAVVHANNLDAGDFTDDEEDEVVCAHLRGFCFCVCLLCMLTTVCTI